MLQNAGTARVCRRFDIVLLLLDQHEPQWDTIVSEHVLANHQQVGSLFQRACRAYWERKSNKSMCAATTLAFKGCRCVARLCGHAVPRTMLCHVVLCCAGPAALVEGTAWLDRG
jgi:hypothetical protein